MAMSQEDIDFCKLVLYFQEQKDDPTRFSDWDKERCKRLMPAFHKAWYDKKVAEEILHRITESQIQQLDL